MQVSNSEPKYIIELLGTLCQIEIRTYEEQPFGDYAWLLDGRPECVERKRFQDFVSSAFSGRLTEQLRGCLEEYSKVYLLIEDVWDRTADGKIEVYRKTQKGLYVPAFFSPSVKYETIIGAIKTCLKYVDIVWSPNMEASAYMILSLSKGVKDEDMFTRVNRKEKRLPVWTRDKQVIKLVNLVPRLPEQTAKALIKRFGSIGVIANLSEEELKQVPRIGDGIIRNIRRGRRGDRSCY